MNRRRFLVISLAGVFAAALAVEAQQPGKVWRVGLFHVGVDHVPPSLDGLRDGLKALGYEEGKSIRLDWRNLVDEDAARTTAQAFVPNRVDLIVAFENQTVRAIQATTTEIPVVMLHVPDPVADGFVKSLTRPGGSITGFAGLGNVPAKEIEIFKEIVPQLRRPLVLFDARDPASPRWLAAVRRAATALKLQAVERQVVNATDLERVFAAVKPGDVDGVLSPRRTSAPSSRPSSWISPPSGGCPWLATARECVEGGALFSYNDNLRAVGRAAAARYVDRILKGAKPADLPVEEVTQFELIINLKAAKALGLTIPPALLARADQVIE